MDDKEWRRYLDPEDLTPEERLQRLTELLAVAVRRLAMEEEERKKKGLPPMEKAEDDQTVLQDKFILEAPDKGRIPFGEMMGPEGREINEEEIHWIKRILELSRQGLSSEKIAQQLNREDHASKRAGKWFRPTVWRILKKLKEKGVT